MDNKHYIRIDNYNRIIKGFSDAFEQPEQSDICINEQGGRHFELFGETNPPPFTMDGIPLYKWDGKAVQRRTDKEIEADRHSVPISKQQLVSELEKSDYMIIKAAEYGLAGLDTPYDMEALHADREAIRERIREVDK
ncbi:MAG: hypothetical protein FWG36_02035 [Oscillospiraceae bacterium]|nr:hypothetical protein [Oscillospiraceae bacterium]